MGQVGFGLKQFVKTGNAAAVFGWAIAFASDKSGICGAGFTATNIAGGEAVLPVFAEIVGSGIDSADLALS
jgi:hypothetical protein